MKTKFCTSVIFPAFALFLLAQGGVSNSETPSKASAVSPDDAWLAEVPTGISPISPSTPSAATAPANAGPSSPSETTSPAPAPYNVRTFGATGDGTTKDTVAFQKALDTCAVNGGGEVLVPAGTYLIGSVQIGTKTILRLEQGATLWASPDLADYPVTDVRWEGRWQPGHRGLIYASNVDHIGIVGPGRIEENVSGTNGPDGMRNPVVLEPVSCNDVRWEGFTVSQGGHWATHPVYCTGVLIKNVNITSRRDGIDVDSCKNVRIDSCNVNTGDDSISLKSGRGMDGARLAKPCENILITNCTLSDTNFACVGIGSETSGGVRNVRIEHCRFTYSKSAAIYIKTRIGRAGADDNIAGDDLDVLSDNDRGALTGGFLQINLISSGNNSTADDPVEGLAGIPSAANLRFSNVRVKCATLVDATKTSPQKPIQGLSLVNITGTCTKGISLANIAGVELHGINVTGYTGDLLTTDHVTGAGLDNPTAGNPPTPAP